MTWRDLTLDEADALSLAASTDAAPMAFAMTEEEFRLFYDRNSRPLWAYLARLTGDRSAADDLMQEAFYRFLRATAAHASLEGDAHRRHYLFRIATNLVRDRHRQSRSRPAVVPHDIERVAGGVDHGGARAEQRTDLTRAMAQLKPRDRAMLWLAYAQGSSHKEIAAVVGVKAESVKPLLFRARRKLAELLGGHA